MVESSEGDSAMRAGGSPHTSESHSGLNSSGNRDDTKGAPSELPLSFHAQALVPESDGEDDVRPSQFYYHSSAESSPRSQASQQEEQIQQETAEPCTPQADEVLSTSAVDPGEQSTAAPSAAQTESPVGQTLGVDERVITGLMTEIQSGSSDLQQMAAEQLRDLVAARAGYREALVALGGLPPLVALLDAPEKPVTMFVSEALGHIASTASCREAIRQGQAVGLLVGTLIHGQDRVGEELRQAILTALAAVAADDPGRLSIHEAGGITLLIKLMNDGSPEAMSTQLATDVIGRLAHADALKTAIRDGGGLSALVRQLQAVQPKEGTLENSSRALTVLLINNRTNQDQLRTVDGLKPLVRMLDRASDSPSVVAASLDALRAATINNEENKAACGNLWLVPQLVKLIGSEEKLETVEKAVDCLRIITTGNDVNKRALVEIPIALPALIRLLEQPQKVACERAVAVLGNLSTSSEYYAALREAGVLAKLVTLLQVGSSSRVTEIAAKSLANLASTPANKTGIRLSGGVPPLVALLMEQPSKQVAHAAELALRTMQISMSERNAIMEAFRYKEARMNGAVEAAIARANAVVEASTSEITDPGNKPFTRYTAKEVAQLVKELGFPDDAAARFMSEGVNGGDALQLTYDDLVGDMSLSKLQAKKIRGLQAAFKVFNMAMRTPGKGELTMTELREFLSRGGLVEKSVITILGGLKEVLGNHGLATLTFKEFLLVYHWLISTVEAMGASLPTTR